jgi:putative transposase
MPWKETYPMEQRLKFMISYLDKEYSFNALCDLYGVSKKTGYKWLHRYHATGADGLKDQSRRPKSCSHQTPYIVRQKILELRHRYGWGPKKLLAIIRSRHPTLPLPCRTTVCNVLKRSGLTVKRKLRRYVPSGVRPFGPSLAPNDIWTVDFKGQFRMLNHHYCYPLTVVDDYSRYLLCCQSLPGTTFQNTYETFIKLFIRYGLPKRIRTDNGVPFASPVNGGLSHLAIWWIRLGIFPERIDPGKPQQNGRHERMHRTLKEKTTRPPGINLTKQQNLFDAFQDEYNTIRPHEALNQKTPQSLYTRSMLQYTSSIPPMTYPSHYEYRMVSFNGCIYWHSGMVYVGAIFHREIVGLEEMEEHVWNVYFGPIWLGRFNEQRMNNANKYVILDRKKP